MSRRVFGDSSEELKTLLAAEMRADAGVGFVNDDERWTGAREAFAALLCLDVVEADNGERVGLE